MISGDIPSTLDDDHAFKTEEVFSNFNSKCADALDSVAPFRIRRTKVLSELWLNGSTCALSCSCRAERKWKKDKLLVSKEALWESLSVYHSAVKQYYHFSDACRSGCKRLDPDQITVMLK